MFFLNKKFLEQIAFLEEEIKSLKNKLQEKEEQINSLNKKLEKAPKSSDFDNFKFEVSLLHKIAATSQEEGLVVFTSKDEIYFANDLAKANIKDFSIVLNAIKHGNDRLIMDDCEAKVVTKNYESFTIVSLKRTSIHDNKEGGLLEKHNKNVTNSLNNTQATYLSLLEELQSMMIESKETAGGSTEGLNLAKEILSDTDNLKTQIDIENEVVSSLVSKSKDISQVITLIQEIAFQTNILSLNAAVEAATAGEAGKGFAVVSAEVRNLANRSAEAAKQIKTLVETATIKANEGKEIANEMKEGYSNLKENINETVELISDISNASREQQIGILQINSAINSLDTQTQNNVQIASKTQNIAINTSEIANTIVKNADEKEFEGKNTIKINS